MEYYAKKFTEFSKTIGTRIASESHIPNPLMAYLRDTISYNRSISLSDTEEDAIFQNLPLLAQKYSIANKIVNSMVIIHKKARRKNPQKGSSQDILTMAGLVLSIIEPLARKLTKLGVENYLVELSQSENKIIVTRQQRQYIDRMIWQGSTGFTIAYLEKLVHNIEQAAQSNSKTINLPDEEVSILSLYIYGTCIAKSFVLWKLESSI